MAQPNNNPRFQIGWRDTLRIVGPYARRNFMNQVHGIWFIVSYLVLFQLLVLQLPIAYAGMIALGMFVVVVGLMFFMEGLRLGLMPLGEVIGSTLPRKQGLAVILLFAFLLGVGATFAEPAIAVLKAAGSGVQPAQSPLLFSLLNEFSGELVAVVGAGVGVAVLLGVLRFFYAWPLKFLAIPLVSVLLIVSYVFSQNPVLADTLGLAWDCGAVTTGPVTVPLVLALGIGVCRVVATGGGNDGSSGFGIVTLASLFPILAVLMLATYHYVGEDYYGAKNYQGSVKAQVLAEEAPASSLQEKSLTPISDSEFKRFSDTGALPENFELAIVGGSAELVGGKIQVSDPELVVQKRYERVYEVFGEQFWDNRESFSERLVQAGSDALRAIIPLCLFMFFVLRFLLKKRLDHGVDVSIGVAFALAGMALFGLGIALGLTPLGSQLGGNIPITFAEILPWGLDHIEGPLFDDNLGKCLAILFAFFLGYGATLAEPALNALGDTVERITVGAFRKQLLMQSVALGVGLGIAAGVCKMAYQLDLYWMLLPAYSLVVVLTWIAPHNFVNFSWDSAGVTTGPITVPLVLAMGLGVGANIPGVSDGFGILALASVGPILTVLTVGLYTQAKERRAMAMEAEAEYTTEAELVVN